MTVVTYVELEDCLICDWDFSWEHPFKKEVTKKKLVPKWKVENVTKVINVETCCDGWHKSEGDCVPFCKNGCVQGNCSAPHTCSCETGYTGATGVLSSGYLGSASLFSTLSVSTWWSL